MKRVIKPPRRDTRQRSIASEAKQRVKARPEQKTEDEYSDSSSFDWEASDQIENSDPGKDTQDQCDFEDTAPYATLKLEGDPLSEEDVGVDPYNTGRFDTED